MICMTIPEGVEEIEHEALIGCRIGTLHIPWTAHVHEYDQLVFSEDPEENEELMPAVYFWTKEYKNRDEETWAFEDEGEYRVDEYGVGRQFVTLIIPRSVRLIGDFIFGPGGGRIEIRD